MDGAFKSAPGRSSSAMGQQDNPEQSASASSLPKMKITLGGNY